MPSAVKAFDFVTVDWSPKKPRKTGVIEIRGPYYTPISYRYLKDLLDDWGEYVDDALRRELTEAVRRLDETEVAELTALLGKVRARG